MPFFFKRYSGRSVWKGNIDEKNNVHKMDPFTGGDGGYGPDGGTGRDPGDNISGNSSIADGMFPNARKAVECPSRDIHNGNGPVRPGRDPRQPTYASSVVF